MAACQTGDAPTTPPSSQAALRLGAAPDGFTAAAARRALGLATLNVVVTEVGGVTLSQDGVGTNTPPGFFEIIKPVGATVRSAHLFAASRGFCGCQIANGEIVLNGSGVTWIETIPNSIASFNHRAVVTSLVKATIDAAPAGVVLISYNETNTFNAEGAVLAVIFDDPAATPDATASLLFGAQSTGGDSFTLTFGDPIDLVGLTLDMSLGISFGFQPAGQFSIVDVNGDPLTRCAGGYDDGQAANGALLTVGGTGDTNGNPTPVCQNDSGGTFSDDELYNLVPFVNDGDTEATVFTQNPSGDDNIFYASFGGNVAFEVGGGDGGGGGLCPAPPGPATVDGADFLGIVLFVGTDGPDIAVGDPDKRNVFIMRGGDDFANGGELTDVFFGGGGDDTWCGDKGKDASFGNTGADHLDGSEGADRNDGGHTPVPSSSLDEDIDECSAGDANFLCEEEF